MHPWIPVITVWVFIWSVVEARESCVCDLNDTSLKLLNEQVVNLWQQLEDAKEVYHSLTPSAPSPLTPKGSLFTTDDVHVHSSSLSQFPRHRHDDPTILQTHNLPRFPNYMPEVGNGHIATVINNEAIFMNGLYNGANITSHRARIPSTAAYMCYGFSPDFNVTYTLNMAKGYFMETHTDGKTNVTLTTFAHRTLTSVIVNLLTISRQDPSVDENVFIHLIEGQPSEDVDFYKEQDGVLLGRTKVPEYPEIAPRTTFFMKTSAPLKGRHIIRAGKSTETIAAFTVIDGSRKKVVEEYEEAVRAFHANTLVPSHFKEWEEIWKEGRIEVEGNVTLSRINYAALYYLYSSLPFNGDRKAWPFIGLSPGGLGHGDGNKDYMGHVFWDQDLWMSPGLSLLNRDIAELLTKTRTRTLEAARLLAVRTGYLGARYPWESALTGLEVCPGVAYSEFEIHVTGDVVLLMRQYWYLTKDTEMFLNGDGYNVVIGAADFFSSRVTYDSENDSYRILDVMPPDEYNYPVDDSVYTNAIARLTLRFANELSRSLGKPENGTWTQIADKLVILYDKVADYNPEYQGYTIHTPVKQADVVLLPYPLMVNLNESTSRNNLLLYEESTPVGPAPAMTWSMFLVGWLELGSETKAAELFARSILNAQKPFFIWTENSDGKGATNFLTGMGGHLQSLIFGYGGCRLHDGYIRFDPKTIPSTTSTTFCGIDYMGCSFDFKYTDIDIYLTLIGVDGNIHGLEIQLSKQTHWNKLVLDKVNTFSRQPFKLRAIKN